MSAKIKSLISLLFLTFFALNAYAASPMGSWRTIDDQTGQPKSIIRIYTSGGTLNGTVTKLLSGATTKICSACSGNLKNRPIVGMTVMYGLRQSRSNPNEWSGGNIMDPKTGKIYRCSLKVSPDGRSMQVRGYIGISLLGRTQ